MRSFFDDLWRLLPGDRKEFVVLVLLFLVNTGLDLLGIGLIGQYVSSLVSGQPILNLSVDWLPDSRATQSIGLFLLAVFILKTLMSNVSNYLIQSVAAGIESNLTADLLRRYQALPYGQWLMRNSSEYINAVNVWVPQYTRSVLIPFIRLIGDGLVAVFVLGFFAYADWRAFVVFGALLLGLGVLYDLVVRGRLARYSGRYKELSVQVVTDVRNAMEGFKEIRILGAEQHFNDRIRRNSSELCSMLARMNTLSQAPRYLIELAIVGFAVLTVAVITASGRNPATVIPVFGVFAAGAIRLVPMMSLVSSMTTNARFYKDAVHSLADDYAMPVQVSPVQRSEGTESLEPFRKLETSGLFFRYDNGADWALKNVNIRISAGETVVFVGKSGAGKTTLVDLLLGLLQPTEGRVVINGMAQPSSANLLRGKVAYLPQMAFLLDDTLRRNVALGVQDSQVDDERVCASLSQAMLGGLIRGLPKGLDETIGDRGVRLSGGQRQRLALARAFYFCREIIVLDEATSAVDEETEQSIVDEVLALRAGRTLIAITHRPSVAKRFDRIYTLMDGEVVANGLSPGNS